MKRWLPLLIIGLIGCSQDYIEGNFIESKVNFMAVEVFEPTNAVQKHVLKLNLITEDYFPCANYSLSTSHSVTNNELIVKFKEIIRPQLCLAAGGPATSHIDLPENINQLTFINGKETNKYSINISKEKITVDPIKSNFTNSLYKNTFRIPENSFAFVCGTNTDNTYIYDEFLSILQQNESFQEFEFKGKGRIPYPEGSDGNWVNFPSKFFLYSDLKAYETLETTLRDYIIKNTDKNSGVTVAIYGWDNFNYYSWMMY